MVSDVDAGCRPMSFTAREGAMPVAPDDASTPTGPASLSSTSVNDKRADQKGVLSLIAVHPRQLALWSQPRRIVTYHLSFEVIALAAMIWACVTAPAPGRADWFRFAALALCATLHIQLSRRQEERRRS